MKYVSLKIKAFNRLINKLKECMRKNKLLNEEIAAYNKKYADRKN